MIDDIWQNKLDHQEAFGKAFRMAAISAPPPPPRSATAWYFEKSHACATGMYGLRRRELDCENSPSPSQLGLCSVQRYRRPRETQPSLSPPGAIIDHHKAD